MKFRPSFPRRLALPALLTASLFSAAVGGCAHPTAPTPLAAPDLAVAEAARREERLKVMQEYWDDHTGATGREGGSGRGGAGRLEYPAGIYAGVNFGPRLAPDASLAEPDR